jgi:hypothetical protein
MVDKHNFFSLSNPFGIYSIVPDFTNNILNKISNSGTDQWIKLKEIQEEELPHHLIPYIKD